MPVWPDLLNERPSRDGDAIQHHGWDAGAPVPPTEARTLKFDYPRKPAKPLVAIFDVDGTLLRLRAGIEKIPYNDADALLAAQEPHQRVVDRALALEEAGFAVRFLTGRSEALRDVTVQQLTAAGFRGVSERLDMQDAWGGWEALMQHKADHLVDWGAVLHVGDQDVDLEASMAAEVPFVHVDDFAAGCSLDNVFCWICGCTALQACRGGCTWANGRVCSKCAVPGTASLHDFAPLVQEVNQREKTSTCLFAVLEEEEPHE